MPISIVYEDSDLLVINKPAGLLTHPVNRTDTSESVVSWVLEKYPEIKNVTDKRGESLGQWVEIRPGIVHRLDKETSGLMIIAKNQSAFDYLKKQFQERKIKKTYMALVVGQLKEKFGRIEFPIGKITGRSGSVKQTTQIHGKHELKEKMAVTEYKVLKTFGSNQSPITNYQLLEVSPLTGRTHQIRVHLKSISHTIVCDPLYGGNNICPPKLGRLFLHAQKISFITPSGQALTLEIDLPPELADFLETLPKIER